MGEKPFEREVLDRLISIETKQDAVIGTVNDHSTKIYDHGTRLVKAEQRLDGIYCGAGILGGIAGTVVNVISSWVLKGSGH